MKGKIFGSSYKLEPAEERAGAKLIFVSME
jgi:hypothetical protein